ncbi:ATP-binding protein [Streptomyces sp. NPDC059166]|uniref:ATP-binding protein n=1 Tax=Streptomyces sp. NPDC059166 TaxID=3346752 RepID=UPI003674FD7F
MREQLRGNGVPETMVDDAVLILSELLSNACRHGRPLGRHSETGDGDIRAAWRTDGRGGLTVEVTDGGGPTRPVPATPSVTARGGRGLNIISALAQEWGVRDGASGEVTVWALVSADHRAGGFAAAPPGHMRSARRARSGPGGRELTSRDGHGTRDGHGGREGRSGLTGLDGLGGISGFGSLDGLELADVLDAFDDAG